MFFPPSRPPPLLLRCVLNWELFAARTTSFIWAWNTEVISFVCVCVRVWGWVGGVTVVSAVNLWGHELHLLNIQASLYLPVWEKMKWQQTVGLPLILCIYLFTHVTHTSQREAAFVKSAPATSFHLFLLPPSIRSIISSWKQSVLHFTKSASQLTIWSIGKVRPPVYST